MNQQQAMNAALHWIEQYSRNGGISETRIMAISVEYAGLHPWTSPEGDVRWYCNAPELIGSKCYAAISKDGMSADFYSNARLKKEQKKDIELMTALTSAAKAKVIDEIQARGLEIRAKKS